MAFTKIIAAGINTGSSYTFQDLNTVGIVTAGTVQVGAATTVHTTGIDLGSGNITSHNINSTGIITATSFVGPVTGNITGDITATSGTFSGNVSIGGTLTYEDVTNIDSVGIITANAGIHLDDVLSHKGNTNTKIRFPAADTITAETNGSERLRITSTGRQQSHAGYAGTSINTFASWARTGGAVRAEVGYNAVTTDYMYFGTGTNHPLALRVNNSNALYIKNDANRSVGIGTDNPSHKLDVVGTTQLYGTLVLGDNSDISPTANGAGQLHIDANGYTPYIAADGTAMYVGHNSSARDLRLQTNETDRLTIDGSSGNIGIGTDNPGQKLTVQGTTSLMATNSTNQWMVYTYTDNTFRLNYNGAGADEITTLSSGEIGLGLGPTAGDGRLQVNGGLRIAGSASASDTTSPYIYRTSGYDHLNFSTNGTERLRIDSSGRITINDGSRLASDANEGAQLRVTGVPITRNQYYSPEGNYYGSFGYTDNTYAKSWIAVDSSYAKSSAVSAGIFLSAFHQDAGGSDCGYTIKNLKTGNALVFSRVKTAASVNNPAVEEERLRITSDGKLILSMTGRTTPHGSQGDGAMFIEQSYDGNLYALMLRNKDTGSSAATSLGFSLNRSGSDVDFQAGQIKLEKEQAWTTTPGTVDGAMVFSTVKDETLAERLRITSSGDFMVKGSTLNYLKNEYRGTVSVTGTNNSSFAFEIQGASYASGGLLYIYGTSGNVVVNVSAEILANHSGDVTIKSMSGAYTQARIRVKTDNNARAAIYLGRSAGYASGTTGLNWKFIPYGGTYAYTTESTNNGTDHTHNTSSGSFNITAAGGGSANVNAQGSKNFLIDHPLVGLSTTTRLAHSAVEGPECNTMYRGKVDLVDGTATVNIDTNSRMTEGTFVALNQNVQCFTTNETGWTAVKGSVSDNLLTVIAQDNTCTDTVSWLVVAERKDQSIVDNKMTDSNGRFIPEVTDQYVESNYPEYSDPE